MSKYKYTMHVEGNPDNVLDISSAVLQTPSGVTGPPLKFQEWPTGGQPDPSFNWSRQCMSRDGDVQYSISGPWPDSDFFYSLNVMAKYSHAVGGAGAVATPSLNDDSNGGAGGQGATLTITSFPPGARSVTILVGAGGGGGGGGGGGYSESSGTYVSAGGGGGGGTGGVIALTGLPLYRSGILIDQLNLIAGAGGKGGDSPKDSSGHTGVQGGTSYVQAYIGADKVWEVYVSGGEPGTGGVLQSTPGDGGVGGGQSNELFGFVKELPWQALPSLTTSSSGQGQTNQNTVFGSADGNNGANGTGQASTSDADGGTLAASGNNVNGRFLFPPNGISGTRLSPTTNYDSNISFPISVSGVNTCQGGKGGRGFTLVTSGGPNIGKKGGDGGNGGYVAAYFLCSPATCAISNTP